MIPEVRPWDWTSTFVRTSLPGASSRARIEKSASRQIDLDGQARLGVTGRDVTTVNPHRTMGDRKPQPDAATFSTAIPLDPEEWLEDRRQGSRGDAGAEVSNDDLRPRSARLHRDLHPRPLRG